VGIPVIHGREDVNIVGPSVQAAAADERSLATHNDASAVLEETKQIRAQLQVQDEAIQKILSALSVLRDLGPVQRAIAQRDRLEVYRHEFPPRFQSASPWRQRRNHGKCIT
jgi:hypothetical protein